ncbi:MAG TPA: hypothetical protein VGH99_16890 [Pseudonocardia sp.]|jgi:heme-degrading monooxygenase HmoA
MFARYTTVRGDRTKIEPAIEYVDGEARTAVEAAPGNLGFVVLADPGSGQIVAGSYWDGAQSMRASEAPLALTRAEASSILDGRISLERFGVLIGFRQSIPGRGAVARMSRFQIRTERVEELITLVSEETAPQVKGSAGLCSFQLLINRRSGSGAVLTAWENRTAAEDFWPTAEKLRARTGDRVGARFSPPDTLTVIRTTVRLG